MHINIETELRKWLTGRLSASVHTEVPNPRPSSFITLERTGGTSDSVILDRPTIAIQCWAATRKEASDLAYEVDALIAQMIEHPNISQARRASFYNFPDLKSGNPRYQVVISLVTTSV